MTTSYTSHFRFPIPDFLSAPWHATVETALRNIDTAIFNALVAGSAGTWAVSTAYVVGDVVIDSADSSLWICGVSHTSASSGTFAADRAAHPTYWNTLTIAITSRGDWANDTAYAYFDLVQDTELGIVALCTTAHTSSSAPNTINADSANWEFLIDISDGTMFNVIGAFGALGGASVDPVNDLFMISDDSASAAKSLTLTALYTAISVLTAITAPAANDLIAISDTSDSAAGRKITLENLFKVINLITAGTDPAKDDKVAVYDTSGGAAAAMTLESLLKVIGGITAGTSPDVADGVAMYDSSGSATVFITLLNLLKVINTLTAKIPTTADSVAIYDAAASAAKKAALSVMPTAPGSIYGLTLSNDGSDATNDIDIAIGQCMDATGVFRIVLGSALVKRLDANWAEGSNQGMRYSGAAIANTTYGIYLASKADGTADIYAYPGAVEATALTALQAETGGADYAYIRRIGFILRESAAIVLFTQIEDWFLRSTVTVDLASANPGTSAVTVSLSVPVGKKLLALLGWNTTNGTPVAAYGLASSLDQADTAPNIQNANFGTQSSERRGGTLLIHTNTSGQIRARVAASDASLAIYISTRGWMDTRGRS